MADAFVHDVEQSNTERMVLVDIAADGGAMYYYRLGLQKPYVSVRRPQGHQILVVFAEYETVNMAALLAALEKSR